MPWYRIFPYANCMRGKTHKTYSVKQDFPPSSLLPIVDTMVKFPVSATKSPMNLYFKYGFFGKEAFDCQKSPYAWIYTLNWNFWTLGRWSLNILLKLVGLWPPEINYISEDFFVWYFFCTRVLFRMPWHKSNMAASVHQRQDLFLLYRVQGDRAQDFSWVPF